MSDKKDNKTKATTLLAHLGSEPYRYDGVVNPPVHRASTFVIHTYEDFLNCFEAQYRYGRESTPTSTAFENAIAALDNAAGAIVTSSGLAAINGAIMSFVSSGDHVLLPDNFYGFSRDFCARTLSRFGVEVEYYDPMIGADIEKQVKDNTKILYLESPGSMTYEVQDIGAFVDVAKKHDLISIIDNSWGTPLHLQPIELGIDISIMSATKYISGHSDMMLGVISCNERTLDTVRDTIRQLGNCAGSEELYLGLRGLRTLDVRMERHRASGLALAEWLSSHDAVKKVLHPALPECPGHENWKKYFMDCSGVFAVVLKETDAKKVANMLDNMELFKMGFSWGGYESLLFPEQVNEARITKPWEGDGFLLRIHPGLEDLDDLKQDLENGLQRLSA